MMRGSSCRYVYRAENAAAGLIGTGVDLAQHLVPVGVGESAGDAVELFWADGHGGTPDAS